MAANRWLTYLMVYGMDLKMELLILRIILGPICLVLLAKLVILLDSGCSSR